MKAKRKPGDVIIWPLRETAEGKRLGWKRDDAEHGLREEFERFESAFSSAPIGMALISMDGRWLQVNSALCRITGFSETELKATTIRSIIHPEDVDLDLPLVQQLVDRQITSYQIEKRCRHALGHFAWVLMTVSLVHGREGQVRYLIAQFQDISERKELARRLEYLVDHDFLTGLFNRRRFERELAQEVERAARYAFPGAVLLIDLDNFKDVNDRFGHMAGDDLLRGIGGLLRHRLRLTDTVARVGGDEFAVLLPHADGEQAQVVADELVKALSRHTAAQVDQSIHITASVGVAVFDDIGEVEVMACADLALYAAKQAGRNCFVVYRPGTIGRDPDSVQHTEVGRIRQAVANDSLLLYCQPIIDLQTMEVSRYELLLRLPGCDGCEPLPPSSFLYVAERFGLILAIDKWVVRKAIGLIASHARAGRRLVFHINLSGKSLGDPTLAGFIEDELAKGGIDPGCLVLELTETAAIANLEQAKSFADRLRRRGCQLALDDFGAGFTSFLYFKNLPFDYLKIDGEFIRGLGNSPVNRLVVQAIVGIAQGMGKKTVAEFVGDADSARQLRMSGVDYGQGYHFGPPRPIGDVLPPISENPA